jgi:hypothetical protein
MTECPLLAQSGQFNRSEKCPLSGVKRTSQNSRCDARPGLTFCYNKIRRFSIRPALRLNLGRMKMATREARLAEFSQGSPKENRPLQILCEDKSGTYIIPYLCQWSDGAWRKVGSAKLAYGAAILARRRERAVTNRHGMWANTVCCLVGLSASCAASI